MGTSALVVEGGAMRGIFAAGVLDAFLEQEHQPYDFTVGVSAGSTNLLGYLAGNHGRSRRIITGHACQKEFINWWRYLNGGHLADVGWLMQQSYNDVPLNLQRCLTQAPPLWVVTTCIVTGEPRYFRLDGDNFLEVLTASCSMPLIYRAYPEVDGKPMTDGGVGDAIPVHWAYQQGARDLTVVLSRPLGFRKKASRLTPLMRRLLADNPALAIAMEQRVERYNLALDFIQQPPADCRVRVIAPPANFSVSRLTTRPERLHQGYQQGHQAGITHLQQATLAV